MGWLDWLKNAVFPLSCTGCGADGVVVCEGCLAQARLWRDTPLIAAERASLCTSLGLDGIFAMYPYAEKVAKGTLRQAKFEAIEDSRFALESLCARGMSELEIGQQIQAIFQIQNVAGEVLPRIFVVPIPTTAARERERGYNQVVWLAESIVGILGQEYSGKVQVSMVDCLYARSRGRQSRLATDEERKQNIQGAFTFEESFRSALSGGSVLLIDDVITSGSTVSEAARVLRNAGARCVMALALARGGK